MVSPYQAWPLTRSTWRRSKNSFFPVSLIHSHDNISFTQQPFWLILHSSSIKFYSTVIFPLRADFISGMFCRLALSHESECTVVLSCDSLSILLACEVILHLQRHIWGHMPVFSSCTSCSPPRLLLRTFGPNLIICNFSLARLCVSSVFISSLQTECGWNPWPGFGMIWTCH